MMAAVERKLTSLVYQMIKSILIVFNQLNSRKNIMKLGPEEKELWIKCNLEYLLLMAF